VGDAGIGVVWGKEVGVLNEFAGSSTPACPEAKAEDADGNNRSREGVDDTDEGLSACDFLADVFAKKATLEVGRDFFFHRGFRFYSLPESKR